MKIKIAIALQIIFVSVLSAQGYRNCANFSKRYNILYGVSPKYSTFSIKNNRTDNFVPMGKKLELSFMTELHDASVIFNYFGELGVRYSTINLDRIDNRDYKYTSLFFSPHFTYSPCAFDNKIGLNINPVDFEYRISSNYLDRLQKTSLGFKVGIFYNVSFYREWLDNKRFVLYHSHLFIEYGQSYYGNFLNDESILGFSSKERKITVGVRIFFEYEY